MRWISPPLLVAGLSVLGGRTPAQASGCVTGPNTPFAGISYLCSSTSSHTVEGPDGTHLAIDAWRTRITARRAGSPDVFDITVDSLSEPLGDPAVQAVLADAALSVGGTGYVLATPALVSSSVAALTSEPLSHVANRTTTVTQISLTSSATSRVFCVGDLGDLTEPPPPLPEPPGCAQGAWKVELRPADSSTMPPTSDRLNDTHVHTQTNSYSTLFATGNLTTSHFALVAQPLPGLPCSGTSNSTGIHYECTSASRHTVEHDSASLLNADVWSTRITGRLPGGPPLFDVTLNADVGPDMDDRVQQAFEDARAVVAAAVGPSSQVSAPFLLTSSVRTITDEYLPSVTRVVRLSSLLSAASQLFPMTATVCVGDLGELSQPPASLPNAPCPVTAVPLELRPYQLIRFGGGPFTVRIPYDDVRSTHVHSLQDVYPGAYVTGTLTISHYELVGVVGEGAPLSLTVPIILSPTGGSAFTSELTLVNRGEADAQVSYVYTPAFGGASSVVTDTLPAERQRIISDAIAYLEGLGVTNPGSGGTLRMIFEGLSSLDAASSVIRTTSAVPGGRAGLSYPGLEPWKLLSAPAYLCGLRQNETDRSNAAVLNAGASGDGDITLRLSVFSGDPGNPGSKTLPDVTLPPGGFTQISGILVSIGLAVSNGYVKVERVSGTAPFYGYAVVNDQITSDGSFVEPVAASPISPIASMTLPVLVETSAYETELILTNVSSLPRTLRFAWVSPSLTGGQASFSIPLAPREQQILRGFVQLLRDRGVVTDPPGPAFAGALFASDDSGDMRGLSVAARVTTKSAGGRFGVFLPAFPSGTEATTTAWLYGLQQNAETRSNLALVNTGAVDGSSSTFRIDLFEGATGTLTGSLVSTVPARGFTQIDRILANYASGTSSGCARVTKISGNNSFIAYAVLIDGAEPGQRSGDGAFVAASLPTP